MRVTAAGLENVTYPEHPREATDRRSQVGDDARLHSAEVGRQSRSSVEAEPTEPEEDRAKHDVGRVVRLVRESLSAIAPTLAEVDGDSERRGTGGDVDGCATGEVKAAHDECPSIRIPRPASNGVVDECRPQEGEHNRGPETSALSDCAKCEYGGDGGEHQLEDTERDGGNTRAAN